MRKDFLSYLLPTSDPDSTLSARTKLWHWLSVFLTMSGIGLIGTGAWLYYQQYVEASKPPPARIVELSLADVEATLTLAPTPIPSATAAAVSPSPESAATSAIELAALQRPATVEKGDATPPPTTPTSRPPLAVKQGSITQPVTTPPAAAQSDEASLSLADNPLPVVEDEAPAGPASESQVEEVEAAAIEAEPAGVPLTRIVAESIELDSEVMEVGWIVMMQNSMPVNVWTVADYAAGWHKNSKLPGQGGNIVMSAHHNIKGEVFRYIVDMEPGDIVTLYNEAGEQYDYAIEDKFIVKDKGEPEAVRQANARWIGPFNEERLTMVTCWPYNNNTHRVIVIGKPVG